MHSEEGGLLISCTQGGWGKFINLDLIILYVGLLCGNPIARLSHNHNHNLKNASLHLMPHQKALDDTSDETSLRFLCVPQCRTPFQLDRLSFSTPDKMR